VRQSLLVISGLFIMLVAVGLHQQASAAGKFDGEWKGGNSL
jgi:hypothetical protein